MSVIEEIKKSFGVTIKEEVECPKLTPWERVQISRHSKRPQTKDYIKHLCENFIELHGDRLYRDDPAIIGGLGLINGQKFMIIGQQKGKDTQERLEHNFGMPHPEGYRKALRLMELAEKFHIPVLTFLDTPGAYPGLAAEERGQGMAIAVNLLKMARLKTPIICLLIGEGCSGGALGMGVGDKVGMLEHAYYSVISPEGCASILWRDAGQKERAAEVLRMQSEDLLEMGIIDAIIKEPIDGAHIDPDFVYLGVKSFIFDALQEISSQSTDELIENRYQKFRRIGVFEEHPVDE